MRPYPKINSIYKRDMEGDRKLIEGVYSLPEFEYLKNNTWRWDEKINGINIRICWYSHPLVQEVEIKGKTDKSQIPPFLLEKLKEMFPKERILEVFGVGEDKPDVCLYGEGYGAKIQKGGGNYISDGVSLILFDIRIGNWWLKREDVIKIARDLDIRVVPIRGYGTLDEAVKHIKEGVQSMWGDFLVEGLVLRPEIELKARSGSRIITKIKHKDFSGEEK